MPTERQQSIGKPAAIALCDSKWWVDKTPREIAEFQLFTSELSCPFSVFHEAIESALGRGVQTLEFGLNVNGLMDELMGDGPAPTMEDILEMIPEDKRVIVVLPSNQSGLQPKTNQER